MATRQDLDVTLSHDRAERIAHLLGELADAQASQARRTQSAVVRTVCEATSTEARELSQYITESLWRWEP